MNSRVYRYKASVSKKAFITGTLFIVLGLVTMALTSFGGIQIACGVVFLFAGAAKKSAAICTLHDDHLELKLAPAAPRVQILYSDISALGRQKQLLKISYDAGSGNKSALVPIELLEDGARLKAELEAEFDRNRPGDYRGLAAVVPA